MREDVPVIAKRDAALDKAVAAEPAPAPKRKPRVARAKISATKPDGTVPTTLGGKLPPVSVSQGASSV
jgi:hypothetical protein